MTDQNQLLKAYQENLSLFFAQNYARCKTNLVRCTRNITFFVQRCKYFWRPAAVGVFSEPQLAGNCFFDDLKICRQIDRGIGQIAFYFGKFSFMVADFEAGEFEAVGG